MATPVQLNTGAGGVWTVDPPDGVTITPTTNPDGTVSALDIFIDYTAADLNDPKLGSILGINFNGPVTDPTGKPMVPGAYPGLVVPTTIEVKNDTGQEINGYTFFNVNNDIGTRQPIDVNGVDAHPDDYAHFHNLTTTSLVDANGTPNATITLQSPDFKPAAFGGPGAQSPLPAPSWINADGNIEPGAIEKLVGLAANGGITLHSEDTPGPNGGSFGLAFYPHATTPINTPSQPQMCDTPNMNMTHVTNPDLLPQLKLAANPPPVAGPGQMPTTLAAPTQQDLAPDQLNLMPAN